MRLHEYEAADIFESAGIPLPARGVARTPEEAEQIAARLGLPVVLKAQVLVGGRGLAGGIKVAPTPEEACELSKSLLETKIKGFPVAGLLVCCKLDIAKEFYLGIAVDGYVGKPMVMASTQGGMRIEDVAKASPHQIASMHQDVSRELLPYQARELFRGLGVSSNELLHLSDILVRLYRVFRDRSALTAEINPLAMTTDGRFIALDAVLEVDDAAPPQLTDQLPNPLERIDNLLERRGREIGVTYVDLEGDIGIIASGAGLGMASMDIIAQKFEPANFLETGGGITAELLYQSMALVMMKPAIRAVFVNVYGGINPIHEGAQGIVRYIREHDVRIPVVAKALGNRQEETWQILRSAGVHVVTDVPTEKAVAELFKLLGA
jgi:succinyl-CoA synthetase beta subunit